MPKHYSQHDFSSISLLGVRIEVNATAPSSPQAGRLWYDTNVNALKVYNGTTWVRADATDALSRANHTGTQTASTISDLATVVQAYRLDQFAAPNASVNLNGQRLTNVGTPSANTDAATKQYVDDARAGISVKDPVKVVATTNINLSAPGASIDGVSMTSGDRFLATAQTTGTQNGIYIWNGAAAAATRATDADTAGEIVDGSLVAVAQGTDAGSQYIQTATPSGAIGAWTQSWVKYSTGGTSYSAGNGLSLSSNTFSVVAADSSITVASGGISTSRSAIGATGKFAGTNPSLTAGTFTSVTHGLNTSDVVVSVRDATSGEAVVIDWKVLDANTVQLRSDVAVSAGVLRVVVVG